MVTAKKISIILSGILFLGFCGLGVTIFLKSKIDPLALFFEPITLIEKISIQSQGQAIDLEKLDQDWQITTPIYTLADAQSMQMILNVFTGLKALRKIEKVESLVAFGLDTPLAVVSVHTTQNDYRYIIGNRDFENKNFYVQWVGHEGVFLVPIVKLNPLRQSLYQLRKKVFLNVPAKTIQQLWLQSSDQILHFYTQFGQWFLSQKNHHSETIDLVDQDKMDTFLEALDNWKADSFLVTTNAQVSDFKLDIYSKDVSQNLTFVQMADKQWGVFQVQTQEYALINSDFLNLFLSQISQWQAQKVLTIDAKKVQKISITHNKNPVKIFVKQSTGHFKTVSGTEATLSIHNLVAFLNALTIEKRVPQNLTNPNRFTIKIDFLDGESLNFDLYESDGKMAAAYPQCTFNYQLSTIYSNSELFLKGLLKLP